MPGAVDPLVECLSRIPEAQVSIFNATQTADSCVCVSSQGLGVMRIKSSRCGKPGLAEIPTQQNKTRNKETNKNSESKKLISEYMQWKVFQSFTKMVSV